jgi:hypothetical protein
MRKAMDSEALDLRVRRPVGAVLSVRVPMEIAAAVDDYAAAHGLSLSEAVRAALDGLLSGGATVQVGGLHGSSTAPYMTVTVQAAPATQRTTSAAETREYYGSEAAVRLGGPA